MTAVRRADPRDAQAATDVLRRSITELCVLDHRGDADTLGKWLANKTPGFRSAGTATPGFGISHCHPYEKELQLDPLMRPTDPGRPAADQER